MDRLDPAVLANPVLSTIVFGYSPVVDRQRAVIATRLVVHPAAGSAAGAIDPTALVTMLTSIWPGEQRLPDGPGDASLAPRPGLTGADVWLSVADPHLWRGVVQAGLPAHVKLEVPGLLLGQPGVAEALNHIAQGGAGLLLRGRLPDNVPPQRLPPLAAALVDVTLLKPGEIGGPVVGDRKLPVVVTGIERSDEINKALASGAAAVIGWPLSDEMKNAGRAAAMPDLQVVMELMQRVKAGDPVQKLEEVLKRDPTVAFRLLKFMNSPGVGVAVEVQSFSHAMMLLGAKRLERWLSLLLVSAGQGAHQKPLMFGAVRRGLLMEALAASAFDDEARGEMFICGTFSLLDQLLGAPLPELLKNVPVPERVRRTLADGEGPFAAYLELVRAIERGARGEIQSGGEHLLLGPAEFNQALITALRGAEALTG